MKPSAQVLLVVEEGSDKRLVIPPAVGLPAGEYELRVMIMWQDSPRTGSSAGCPLTPCVYWRTHRLLRKFNLRICVLWSRATVRQFAAPWTITQIAWVENAESLLVPLQPPTTLHICGVGHGGVSLRFCKIELFLPWPTLSTKHLLCAHIVACHLDIVKSQLIASFCEDRCRSKCQSCSSYSGRHRRASIWFQNSILQM